MTHGMGRKKIRITGVSRWLFLAVLGSFLLKAGALWASSAGHEGTGQVWAATDTYRIICFVVLAVALIILIRKWVAPFFGGRIQGIKDELDDLEARKKDAEEKLAHYNERLADMEKEAGKIVESYIEQGKEAQARIIEQAKASAEKLEAHARRQIENAFQRTRAEVQEAIIEQAMAKAEAAIREHITTEDQTKLVDEYLEKVVA